MPLSSESLLSERKGRIKHFLAIIRDSQGETKRTFLARARMVMGVRRSTIYDYYETLLDAGLIVEEDSLVWTKEGYETLRQTRLETEARKEEQLVKVQTLDAYDTSEA